MPISNKTLPKKYSYGTAGFRMESQALMPIASKLGTFAGFLSRSSGSKAIAVMITASHNPEPDNGIKIIGHDGLMLISDHEIIIESFVNSKETENSIKDLVEKLKIRDKDQEVFIIIGRDTRPSGINLGKEIINGVKYAEGKDCSIIDLGKVTTPQVHFATFAFNNLNLKKPEQILTKYFEFIKVYKSIVPENRTISIDFANGVGRVLLDQLRGIFNIKHEINTSEDGLLNEGSGADYVKTFSKCPTDCSCKTSGICYSFDGDADRLIAHYIECNPKDKNEYQFCLLDGDYMSALFALHIKREVGESDIKIAVVHTAYSNGAFMEFLNDRGIKRECVPTGVKHLHEAASKYDIGIYFEANGHGTVLFSPNVDWSKYPKLHSLSKLFNQLVGDALTDLLAVEAILYVLNWSHRQWYSLYSVKPNKLFKINVLDKSIFKPNASEERLEEPKDIQKKIDKIIDSHHGSRAFVRPSGTENVLRLYVEGSSVEKVEEIGISIIDLFN